MLVSILSWAVPIYLCVAMLVFAYFARTPMESSQAGKLALGWLWFGGVLVVAWVRHQLRVARGS